MHRKVIWRNPSIQMYDREWQRPRDRGCVCVPAFPGHPASIRPQVPKERPSSRLIEERDKLSNVKKLSDR